MSPVCLYFKSRGAMLDSVRERRPILGSYIQSRRHGVGGGKGEEGGLVQAVCVSPERLAGQHGGFTE